MITKGKLFLPSPAELRTKHEVCEPPGRSHCEAAMCSLHSQNLGKLNVLCSRQKPRTHRTIGTGCQGNLEPCHISSTSVVIVQNKSHSRVLWITLAAQTQSPLWVSGERTPKVESSVSSAAQMEASSKRSASQTRSIFHLYRHVRQKYFFLNLKMTFASTDIRRGSRATWQH